MQPTPEQLTRAAELAPKVARIAGLPCKSYGQRIIPTRQSGRLVYVGLLDPRTLQAVVLALPANTYGWAMVQAATDAKMTYLEFIRYILTPAGMLAFYEALVKAQEEDGKTE